MKKTKLVSILTGGIMMSQLLCGVGETVSFSPAETWHLKLENGRKEVVTIQDGVLFHVPGGPRLNGVAVFSQEITSNAARTLVIGIGADWFWGCRLNGQLVADHFKDGNQRSPIRKSNYVVRLPVKAGRNLLEIEVRSGSDDWSIAVGALPVNCDPRQEQLDALLKKASRPQDKLIASYLGDSFFKAVSSDQFTRKLYPSITDRQTWERVKREPAKEALTRQIIREADKAVKRAVPPLPFSLYRRFILDGDRAAFETPYLTRRCDLGTLVLAFCLTNDRERYLPKIVELLSAISEEWTWCLPAHMNWNAQTKYPEKDFQSDLFASQTGAVVALTLDLIGEVLEEEWPALTDRLRRVACQHTLGKVFQKESCGRNHWVHDEKPINWTPWCCTELIITALLLEPDGAKRAQYVQALLKGASRFIWYYADDGFCPEGPVYYGVAGGSLYRLSVMLERVQPGCLARFYADPKIRAIFEFVPRVMIHDQLIPFADSTNDASVYRGSPLLQSCAVKLNSASLARISAGKLALRPVGTRSAMLIYGLLALFDLPGEKLTVPRDAEEAETLFADRLGVFRSSLFSASIKAGTNGESHNHNDLGHFSLWYGDLPLIVDAGAGVYTKTYFSKDRYTLPNPRGRSHNAPVIHGVEQLAAKQFLATLRRGKTGERQLVCDLAQSYPAEAGVISFTRVLDFSPRRVVVKDDLKLRTPGRKELRLLSPISPKREGNKLSWEGVTLTLENLRCTAIRPAEGFQKMNYGGKVRGSVQTELTEIVLETELDHYSLTFRTNAEESAR